MHPNLFLSPPSTGTRPWPCSCNRPSGAVPAVALHAGTCRRCSTRLPSPRQCAACVTGSGICARCSMRTRALPSAPALPSPLRCPLHALLLRPLFAHSAICFFLLLASTRFCCPLIAGRGWRQRAAIPKPDALMAFEWWSQPSTAFIASWLQFLADQQKHSCSSSLPPCVVSIVKSAFTSCGSLTRLRPSLFSRTRRLPARMQVRTLPAGARLFHVLTKLLLPRRRLPRLRHRVPAVCRHRVPRSTRGVHSLACERALPRSRVRHAPAAISRADTIRMLPCHDHPQPAHCDDLLRRPTCGPRAKPASTPDTSSPRCQPNHDASQRPCHRPQQLLRVPRAVTILGPSTPRVKAVHAAE